jgi:SAM-dependent methyltransferase
VSAPADLPSSGPNVDDVGELEGRTWHYGLVARWWVNKQADPDELSFYRNAIREFGQPALDLACGTGRLLVPLLAEGLDIDGVDLSEDMLDGCRERAAAAGVAPRLWAQPMHELDLTRRYRTIYVCDSFGIGGSHRDDRQALRRIHDHLVPGGAVVISTGFPYDDEDEWRLWLPQHRAELPRSWPDTPGRQEQPNGDVILQWTRLVDIDPRRQRLVLGIRDQLLRGDTVMADEEREIAISLYFEQELRLALELAGFTDLRFEAGYSGRPATADDTDIVVIARRPL